MTIAQVNQLVIDIIIESTETELELHENTHLVREMGLSSVEATLLLSDLEDRFHIHIPVLRLREIETVGDLCQTVVDCLRTQ